MEAIKPKLVGHDDAGRATWVVDLGPPFLVFGGDESLVVLKNFEGAFPGQVEIFAADSFIGTEGGDTGEFDLFAYINGSYPVYKRSLHMPVAYPYDAYGGPQYYRATGRKLTVHVLARAGMNHELDQAVVDRDRSGKRLSAKPHFCLYIYTLSAPTPPAPEPPPSGSADYITQERAYNELIPTLTKKLQANIWSGCRDLDYTAKHCTARIEEVFGITQIAMLDLANIGQNLDIEGQRFLERLHMPNPNYPGRTVVRKVLLSEYMKALDAHLFRVSELRQKLNNEPGAGVEWDSIKGWCERQQ